MAKFNASLNNITFCISLYKKSNVFIICCHNTMEDFFFVKNEIDISRAVKDQSKPIVYWL